MTYDKILAIRVRETFGQLSGLEEKKMFGGVGFLVYGNMACGVHGDGLIVRVGIERYQAALSQPYTRVFDLTGKPMAGWIVVEPKGCETDRELKHWLNYGVEYARSLPPK